MKSVNCIKQVYASILVTCSKISNIPYNLIFTTKFNDSSILITIISCDYLHLSLANEYVGDITIPTQVIMYNKCCSRRFSQSDCSIQIKLKYYLLLKFSYKMENIWFPSVQNNSREPEDQFVHMHAMHLRTLVYSIRSWGSKYHG